MANNGQSLTDPTNVWVPLLEKAYAQGNQSGWFGRDGSDAYWVPFGQSYNANFNSQYGQGIAGGFPDNVFNQLAPENTAQETNLTSQSAFNQAVTSGELVCLDTLPQPSNNSSVTYTVPGAAGLLVRLLPLELRAGLQRAIAAVHGLQPLGLCQPRLPANQHHERRLGEDVPDWSQITQAYVANDIGPSSAPNTSVMQAPSGLLSRLPARAQTDLLSATIAGSLATGDAKGKTTSASIGTLAVATTPRRPVFDDPSVSMWTAVRPRLRIAVDDGLARDVYLASKGRDDDRTDARMNGPMTMS